MARRYFTPASLRFLRALEKNNNRPWFHAHKAEYEQHVREPFLDFISDLSEPLAGISPHYRVDARKVGGSMYRIYRDLRYSKNKMPYKYWAGARLMHERRREMEAPSFYIHIQPGHCRLGGGIWAPSGPTLRQLREFLVDNPASWKKVTRSRTFRRHFEWMGENLKRAPRGFDADHELIDDLKRKNLAVMMPISDELACSDKLLPTMVTTMKRLAPLMDYLCAARDLEF